MNTKTHRLPVEQFKSYAAIAARLLPGAENITFLAPDGEVYWSASTTLDLDLELMQRIYAAMLNGKGAQIVDPERSLAVIPCEQHGTIMSGLLVSIPFMQDESPEDALRRSAQALEPLCDCLGRDLTKTMTLENRKTQPTDLADEFEWLFNLTAKQQPATSDAATAESLLAAAVERMNASFGAVFLPEKRLDMIYSSRILVDEGAAETYRQTQPHLLSYVQRREAPLLANSSIQKDRNIRPRKILAVPLVHRKGDKGSVTGLIAFLRPVTQPDFAYRELHLAKYIARHVSTMLADLYDFSTGLLTREALEREAARLVNAAPAGIHHSVAYLDIDDLHIVNEGLGFEAGDEAIVRIASALQPALLTRNALAGHIAGDRFAIFFPESDVEQTKRLIHALQREINKVIVGTDDHRIVMSVSAGIAQLPDAPGAFSKALAASELACRAAKERGRNHCEVYLDLDDSMIRRHNDIVGIVRLRSAIDKNRLTIFAQKISPLHDLSRPSGFECLVRLVADDGEIIPPSAFISAAQRYQMLQAIDEWTFRNAIKIVEPYVAVLRENNLQVSLNVSGQSINDESFLHRMEAMIRRSKVPPGQVMLEITETSAISNMARTENWIRQLKKIGCKFALDDFGTGVNSLSYLKNLRVDRVKIDGSFVRDIVTSASSEATVLAIVQLARAYKIDCVAEFVESEALIRKTRELGVQYAQGHAIHKPEPLTELLQSMRMEESQRLHDVFLRQ